MPDKDTEKQQQETLSIRISRQLRQRLEKIRDAMARRTGDNITTSEIAKQLLESAQADHLQDRIEASNLLSQPTDSLRTIRRKCETRQPLSRAEWNVFAYYVQQGIEALSTHPVSRQSCTAILQAFLAVHQLRKGGSDQEGYFLANLPSLDTDSDESQDQEPTAERVRETVTQTIERLKNPALEIELPLIGRNLYTAIDEDASRLDLLQHALHPHWQPLWRVAARGHYLRTQQPIREHPDFKLTPVHEVVIPSVQEGDYSLDFAWDRQDFDALLRFPQTRGAMFAFGGYPRLLEFRALLQAFDPQALPESAWHHDHFFAYGVQREQKPELWVRPMRQGVTFRFFLDEWGSIRALFQRAWAMPELQMIWDRLTMEYGEL